MFNGSNSVSYCFSPLLFFVIHLRWITYWPGDRALFCCLETINKFTAVHSFHSTTFFQNGHSLTNYRPCCLHFQVGVHFRKLHFKWRLMAIGHSSEKVCFLLKVTQKVTCQVQCQCRHCTALAMEKAVASLWSPFQSTVQDESGYRDVYSSLRCRTIQWS